MIIFSTVILIVAALASAKDLPEYLHICRAYQPDLNDCVLKAMNHLRPYLAKGIPEMKVPPLEPLELDEIVAFQGNGIKVSAKNIKAYGSSDFVVSNIEVDPYNFTVNVNIAHPHMYITGTYYIDGKLLTFPLSGSGEMRINRTDSKGFVRIKAALKKHNDGEEYLYCTDLDLKISTGNGHIHLDNLFGGDETLGEVVNSAINSNFLAFDKEVAPLATKALTVIFKKIIDNIFSTYTAKQLFPHTT